MLTGGDGEFGALNVDAHMTISADNWSVTTTISTEKESMTDKRSLDGLKLGKIGFRCWSDEKCYVDNIIIKNGSGEVLFDENFENINRQSFDFGTKAACATMTDGRLYLDSNGKNLVAFNRSKPLISYTNFTADMDFTIENAAMGIVFGATDDKNFYMWQVHAGGGPTNDAPDGPRMRPHRWQAAKASVLGSQPYVNDTVYGGKSNAAGILSHIRIVVREAENSQSKIETYLQDLSAADSALTLVDTQTTDSVALNKLGFRAINDSNAEKAESFYADNLTVTDQTGNIIFADDFSDASKNVFPNTTVTDGRLYVAKVGLTLQSEGAVGAPMLRKTFDVDADKTVASARLYATAAGIYDMRMNGQAVSDTYFNPGSTQYNKTLLYQTYDVTNLLKKGKNAMGATLGHGWYNASGRNYGDNLGLYAKLVVTYTDGTADTVVTDGSWHYYAKGPVLSDSFFDGESYDASCDPTGWDLPGFDDSAWLLAGTYTRAQLVGTQNQNNKIGEILAQNFEPIRVVKTLKPVKVTEPEKGVFVYDFGQNIAGIPRIKFRGSCDTTVKLRYAEILNRENMQGNTGAAGTLYTGNLRNAKCTDYYTLRGDADGEVFEPRFTYHGFQYMEITGLDEAVPIEDVEALALSTDLEETGQFSCSDDRVNRLFSNARWSQIDNFMSIPTDCPQRGERYGWLGDAQIFARTAAYNSNIYAFYNKYTKDIRDGQQMITSALPGGAAMIPDVAPSYSYHVWDFRKTNGEEVANNGWGDAIVIIPWQMYLQYGNPQIIIENYNTMRRWVNYLVQNSDNFVRAKSYWGDWMVPGKMSPKGVTDTAFCSYSARLLSKMARVVGNAADEKTYADYADKFKEAWNREFVNADGSTKCDTQTSYVLGLYFDLFPEDLRESAAAHLEKNVRENGWRLCTGFLGGSYLTSALADNGYSDTAYRLLLQTAQPSWLYAVTTGATSIWEKWDVLNINEDGSSKVYAESMNHFSYGSIVEWLYKAVAGIDRDDNALAFQKFVLKPTFGEGLTSAQASYESMYGSIESGWNIEGSTLTYRAAVPANTTATLTLPAALPGKSVTVNGQSVESAEGISRTASENGKTSYALEAGTYTVVQEIDPSLYTKSYVYIENAAYDAATGKLSATVKDYEKELTGCSVILAAYGDENQLLDVEIVPASLTDGQAAVSHVMKKDGVKSCKIMVWDSADRLTPVTEEKIISVSQ